MSAALAAVLAYLLGAFPTGYLVGRFVGRVDVREHGSGSTGATNVARTLGIGWAAGVMAVDVGKGVLAVVLARALGAGALGEALAGLMVVVGHSWPVFAGFKGGRGVATGLGGLLLIAAPVAGAGVAMWLAAVALTRYVSLGSTLGAGIALGVGVLSLATGTRPWEIGAYMALASAVVILRHRENIGRLLAGTERKLEQPPEPSRSSTPANSGAGATAKADGRQPQQTVRE